jgi:hypothetical protein
MCSWSISHNADFSTEPPDVQKSTRIRSRATRRDEKDCGEHRQAAKYWRSRAEEARAVAAQTKDTHTKAVMLSIAQDYKKLSLQAEQRANGAAKFFQTQNGIE